jgi:hypothetical protein
LSSQPGRRLLLLAATSLTVLNASTIHIAAIAPISQHQSATEPAWLKARELNGLSRCRALTLPNCGTATTS